MEHPLGYLVLAAGVLALVWAFVRPRRGREPHCRACRFSLTGLTEPALCPECGKGLTRPRAIILGHRPSPKRLVFWSVGLALAGSALLTLDRKNRTGFFPLTSHKPAWLLHTEAYALGDLRASMATIELADRITDGTLAQSHRDRLVRTALARHAQTWRAFPDAQWQQIADATGRGELTFEQIERVWNNCFGEAKLISFGSGDGRFFPGEIVRVSARVNTRAGKLISQTPLAPGGFLLGISSSMGFSIESERGEYEQKAMLQLSSNIVQRFRGRFPGRGMDDVLQIQIAIPETLGSKRGFVEYELSCSTSYSRAGASGLDPALAERLSKLKKTFRLPFDVHIVEAADLTVEAIDPRTVREDTSSLVKFEAIKVEPKYRRLRQSQPKAFVRLWVNRSIDPTIGLGGRLVFEQGSHTYSMPVSVGPRVMDSFHVPLDDFWPGPVRVGYVFDHEIAVRERSRIARFLGGTIDLGTITIPESE